MLKQPDITIGSAVEESNKYIKDNLNLWLSEMPENQIGQLFAWQTEAGLERFPDPTERVVSSAWLGHLDPNGNQLGKGDMTLNIEQFVES